MMIMVMKNLATGEKGRSQSDGFDCRQGWHVPDWEVLIYDQKKLLQ